MNTYCAICEQSVDPATEHIEIEASTRPKEHAASVENYLVHARCWNAISEGWSDPV